MSDQPVIFLDFRQSRIRVHTVTLRLLGMPTNILLLVNPQKRTICVQTGSPEDPSSHRISSQRQNHSYYELHSKNLMEALRTCGGWDTEKNYRIKGTVINGGTTALFRVEDSVCATPEA